jgi:general secretion pathway protein C
MIRRWISLGAGSVRHRSAIAVSVLTGLVVVSIAAALAGLTWRLAGLNDGRTQVTLAQRPETSALADDLTPILSLAPFGRGAGDVQATAAGMVLKAIFLASPATASTAVIARGDSPATAYRPGQALGGGAVIQSIGVDHVVIQIGDRTERLEFPEPGSAAGGQPAPATARSGLLQSERARGSPAASPSPERGSGMNPSVVEQYRQRLAASPEALATELNVTATAAGLRVGDNPPAALRAAGLQPGDIVLKVNNQPVGALGNARAILDQAITSGGARVEVLRSGRRITLSFPLR